MSYTYTNVTEHIIAPTVKSVTYAPERGPHGSTLIREGSNIESILIVVCLLICVDNIIIQFIHYYNNRHTTILCLRESIRCEWDLD